MHIISATTLLDAIKKAGVTPYNEVIVDNDYVLPRKDWIIGPYSSSFRHFLGVLGNLNYLPDKNDCDDFSEDARYFMRLLHRKSQKAFRKGVAVGMYHYDTDSGTGHAINNFVTVDPETNKYEVLFYEPQTQQIVTLSEQEKASCRTLFI